jgi:gluconate 2-dehydrogenase alpha chain
MSQKLPAVDALMIGFGWTGAIVCQELTDAGLQVLALERGNWRDTATDFSIAFIQDELRYRYRSHLFQEPDRETVTFRDSSVGGTLTRWNGS